MRNNDLSNDKLYKVVNIMNFSNSNLINSVDFSGNKITETKVLKDIISVFLFKKDLISINFEGCVDIEYSDQDKKEAILINDLIKNPTLESINISNWNSPDNFTINKLPIKTNLKVLNIAQTSIDFTEKLSKIKVVENAVKANFKLNKLIIDTSQIKYFNDMIIDDLTVFENSNNLNKDETELEIKEEYLTKFKKINLNSVPLKKFIDVYSNKSESNSKKKNFTINNLVLKNVDKYTIDKLLNGKSAIIENSNNIIISEEIDKLVFNDININLIVNNETWNLLDFDIHDLLTDNREEKTKKIEYIASKELINFIKKKGKIKDISEKEYCFFYSPTNKMPEDMKLIKYLSVYGSNINFVYRLKDLKYLEAVELNNVYIKSYLPKFIDLVVENKWKLKCLIIKNCEFNSDEIIKIKELFSALKDSLEEIHLVNTMIDSKESDSLFENMKILNKLTLINLSYNYLDSCFINFLLDFIKESNLINSIILQYCCLKRKNINTLYDNLANNLELLDLEGISFENDAKIVYNKDLRCAAMFIYYSNHNFIYNTNYQLTKLEICLTDLDIIKKPLFDLLKNLPYLEEFSLLHCYKENMIYKLLKLLQNRCFFKSLILRGCNINNTQSAKYLSSIIQHKIPLFNNKTLHSLDISHCQIEDHNFALLINSIKESDIVKLNIENNMMTNYSFMSILDNIIFKKDADKIAIKLRMKNAFNGYLSANNFMNYTITMLNYDKNEIDYKYYSNVKSLMNRKIEKELDQYYSSSEEEVEKIESFQIENLISINHNKQFSSEYNNKDNYSNYQKNNSLFNYDFQLLPENKSKTFRSKCLPSGIKQDAFTDRLNDTCFFYIDDFTAFLHVIDLNSSIIINSFDLKQFDNKNSEVYNYNNIVYIFSQYKNDKFCLVVNTNKKDIKKYLIKNDYYNYRHDRIVADNNVIIEFSTKKHLKYNILKLSDDENLTITNILSDEISNESLNKNFNSLNYFKNRYLIIYNSQDALLSFEIIRDSANCDITKIIKFSNIYKYSSIQSSRTYSRIVDCTLFEDSFMEMSDWYIALRIFNTYNPIKIFDMSFLELDKNFNWAVIGQINLLSHNNLIIENNRKFILLNTYNNEFKKEYFEDKFNLQICKSFVTGYNKLILIDFSGVIHHITLDENYETQHLITPFVNNGLISTLEYFIKGEVKKFLVGYKNGKLASINRDSVFNYITIGFTPITYIRSLPDINKFVSLSTIDGIRIWELNKASSTIHIMTNCLLSRIEVEENVIYYLDDNNNYNTYHIISNKTTTYQIDKENNCIDGVYISPYYKELGKQIILTKNNIYNNYANLTINTSNNTVKLEELEHREKFQSMSFFTLYNSKEENKANYLIVYIKNSLHFFVITKDFNIAKCDNEIFSSEFENKVKFEDELLDYSIISRKDLSYAYIIASFKDSIMIYTFNNIEDIKSGVKLITKLSIPKALEYKEYINNLNLK